MQIALLSAWGWEVSQEYNMVQDSWVFRTRPQGPELVMNQVQNKKREYIVRN